MPIIGTAKIDYRTKNLVKRLKPGDIAIINHEDIDEVGALGLVGCKVKAVVNSAKSITGRYPNPGPSILLDANIPVLDNVGEQIMSLKEGSVVTIEDNGAIYVDNKLIAKGEFLKPDIVKAKLELARQNIENSLEQFINNTLEYAKKEKYLIMGGVEIPEVKTTIKDRHVLIVVRGNNYKEDLAAIKTYIDEVKPVLVGVDGGADALLEYGYIPDIIIGDMDSVSDNALKICKDIIVHAYPDGRAPGLARVQALGLDAVTFKSPGTSEDIAMLLAYEKGADLIVAVGTHSSMIDFLEKGRKGMGSTFLVRLKIGSILVDAKGVSKLYNQKLKPSYMISLFAAAMVPIIVISTISPPIKHAIKLLELRLKMLLP
ncbi:putative cytokinetic ring protein SteA [Tepidanaerobacter sp. EBM-38]|uniref:putative cytokinetic ring protein SteA n=1 Tax=Tepidanaerobacter sp. EBM-38 TaxID=1918496 RepID=UPI000A533948|nr:putative cytokinetic ring protein SteA [Tepidanaerobacter sp. EBM-38]